jgi:hypothetical protein
MRPDSFADVLMYGKASFRPARTGSQANDQANDQANRLLSHAK